VSWGQTADAQAIEITGDKQLIQRKLRKLMTNSRCTENKTGDKQLKSKHNW